MQGAFGNRGALFLYEGVCPADDVLGDQIQGEHTVCGVEFDRGLWHTIDRRGCFILGDGSAACSVNSCASNSVMTSTDVSFMMIDYGYGRGGGVNVNSFHSARTFK